jgi:hypothetical protein
VASDAVLEIESRVNAKLTTAYRHLMEVAGESDSSTRQARLVRIIGHLDGLTEQQGHVRALMRLEVRATQDLPDWYDPEIGQPSRQHDGH